MKELEERIQEFAQKAGLSSKELSTIRANKTAVELYMTFHKKQSPSPWEQACLFGLYSNTYKFNEARKNSTYEDAIEFFDNEWNSEVTLNNRETKITMKMFDLVSVCESNEFLDEKCEAGAKEFLKGNFSDEDFRCLLTVVESNPRVRVQTFNSGDFYAEIITADELRAKLCERTTAREFKKACDTIFKMFNSQVFKGCACCDFVSQEVSKNVVKSLKAKLEAIHLLVTVQNSGDTVIYSVRPEPVNGDYNCDYSEEELKRLLDPNDGGTYYFVQSYCEKVYIPKFIKRIVDEVATELRRVAQEGSAVDDFICIEKHKTSTDAYATLFSILKSKGFEVCEYEDKYEIKWSE